jgi:hypothetical protein
MVDFVAPVEDITHHLCWWGVNNSGGNNIRHISVVVVLWYAEFGVRVEPTDGCKMDIAPKDCISKRNIYLGRNRVQTRGWSRERTCPQPIVEALE